MLTLEDLKGYSEEELRVHVLNSYEYSLDVSVFEFLIAYESVGCWGCDSSSFFLLRNKETNQLYEVHGSHCSCYGFEGQFEMDETSWVALSDRVQKGGAFYTGGYDDSRDENMEAVDCFILDSHIQDIIMRG